VKAPSNDPLTIVAIARTMIEMAPGHPITRHLTVGYCKGGDEAIESRIYQPQHIEKLVAWGGRASIRHSVKYIRPGIDLITMDPKLSMTMVGREALADDAIMRTVAMRAVGEQMKRYQSGLDFILDTISGVRDLNAYIRLLKNAATLCMLGIPQSVALQPMSLIARRKVLAGSNMGGLRGTQEMLDFCGKHGIGADIQLVALENINTALDSVPSCHLRAGRFEVWKLFRIMKRHFETIDRPKTGR
jgi:D-arabinose 1-dehydrogenase-like Zn-dependent alcohol dehydrogenase